MMLQYAAAMTDDFTQLKAEELQERLIKSGVIIHEKDIL